MRASGFFYMFIDVIFAKLFFFKNKTFLVILMIHFLIILITSYSFSTSSIVFFYNSYDIALFTIFMTSISL